MNQNTNPQPFQVGDGATICRHTDARAYTIIKTTRTKITLQRDKASLQNGPTSGAPDALTCHAGGFAAHVEGTQRWEYESDPHGSTETARWSEKRGKWISACGTVIAGRHEHYDYNF